MNVVVEEYAVIHPDIQKQIEKILGKLYWRANTLTFTPRGFVFVTDDQGGHPFEAMRITMEGSVHVVSMACLAFVRALEDYM